MAVYSPVDGSYIGHANSEEEKLQLLKEYFENLDRGSMYPD